MAKASQYLKLVDKNGNMVDGECYDAEYLNEISLTGWNWGVSDPAAVPREDVGTSATVGASGGGGAAGRGGRRGSRGSSESDAEDDIKPDLFTIDKQTDKSTVRLIKAMDDGEVFPKARLLILEEYEASPLPFWMEILLTDVFLVDMHWNASAAGAGMEFEEKWELNYRTIAFNYLWRGSPPAKLGIDFERKANADAELNARVPPTKAEQKAAEDKRVADAVAANQKKTAR